MTKGNYSETDIQRFWSKVAVTDNPDDCWEWTVRCPSNKYGQLRLNGKSEYVHRVSWFLAYGEIPDGLQILHQCDNPPCCNPNHLFLGTQRDNMDDMRAKGRKARLTGEKNGKAKLTSDQVQEIRELYATGEFTHRQLAGKYSVGHVQIGRIVRREYWQWEAE